MSYLKVLSGNFPHGELCLPQMGAPVGPLTLTCTALFPVLIHLPHQTPKLLPEAPCCSQTAALLPSPAPSPGQDTGQLCAALSESMT
jgi:hypothetical protein